ncbi:MAG: sugar transferase [Bacteroidales bacterium]|jgi:exopolysaccharide biosynthesis polyprenyl glycosylphosphotransferase
MKANKIKNTVKDLFSVGKIQAIFPFLDIFITILSYFTAYYIANLIETNYFVFTIDYVYMLLLIIPTWALLLKTMNLSDIPRTRSTLSVLFKLLNFNFIGFLLIFLYKHIFHLEIFSHYMIISFTIVNLLSLFLLRMIIFRVFKYFRVNGHNVHNVIIYADDESDQFISDILTYKEWGFRILMILTTSEKIRKKYGEKIRVLPDKISIRDLIKVDIIDEVIYCKSKINENRIQELIRVCEEIGVIFRLQSSLSPMTYTNAYLTNFNDMQFLTFNTTPRNRFALSWKSFMDFWVSFTILFLLSPFMMFISVAILATSKGPVIFKQERVGLRGRKFYIYKFRTMVQNAEELKDRLMEMNESDGPAFKIKKDPRITTIGRILRKTGLDELPQLFNVLKGEMSLIGPRPPLPEEVEKYERWQLRRLSVKPGITCTWQIFPNRNDVIFEKWMKLDMQYIDNWSLKADFILFFRTIVSVFRAGGH